MPLFPAVADGQMAFFLLTPTGPGLAVISPNLPPPSRLDIPPRTHFVRQRSPPPPPPPTTTTTTTTQHNNLQTHHHPSTNHQSTTTPPTVPGIVSPLPLVAVWCRCLPCPIVSFPPLHPLYTPPLGAPRNQPSGFWLEAGFVATTICSVQLAGSPAAAYIATVPIPGKRKKKTPRAFLCVRRVAAGGACQCVVALRPYFFLISSSPPRACHATAIPPPRQTDPISCCLAVPARIVRHRILISSGDLSLSALWLRSRLSRRSRPRF
jgi:hypothetical protein